MTTSEAPLPSRRAPSSGTRTPWLANRSVDAARILLICAIFSAVWGIGGLYPEARFITLALIAAAASLALLGASEVSVQLGRIAPLLLVFFAAIAYGFFQVAPFSFGGTLQWTGVSEIQSQFGATSENRERQ